MEHVNIWSSWSCKSVHKCKHRSHFDCTSPAKDMFYPMTSPSLQWPSVKYASLHPERIKLSVKLESDFQALSCDLTIIVQLALVAVSGDVIKQSPDPYLARLASRWMALLVLASPGVADLYCTDNCISVVQLCWQLYFNISAVLIEQSPDTYLASLRSHWGWGSQVPFGEVVNCVFFLYKITFILASNTYIQYNMYFCWTNSHLNRRENASAI